MPVNLTGATIASTYDQLLHVDDGPTATEKTVYSGTGVATAMKVGTTSASVGNVQLTGNTIRTLDINGNLILAPNGTGSVAMTKVAITGGTISGITDLAIADGGTGASTAGDARTNLGLGTIATQAANNVAITGGAISGITFTGSFVGITLIESDKFSTKNGTDGVSLEDNNIFAEGASANIDIDIAAKGTGEVNITSKFGYGTGVGGTVTQLTNKATGVTLNKLSGQITMNNATLNRNSGVSFTLTNSFIATTDVVVACIASGATLTAYSLNVTAVSAGSCSLHLHNLLSGTDLSEALVLNFIVIKGVAA